MTDQQPTYFDKSMARLKNHPIVARILIVCIAIAGVAGTLEATQRILTLFQSQSLDERPSDVKDGNGNAVSDSNDDEAKPQVAMVDAPFSPATFEEYVHKAMTYSGVDQTYLQRKAYIESMNGRKVIWEGSVLSVYDDSGGGATVSLGHDGRYAWFKFEPSAKTRLLALKPGDVVQLTGVIELWDVEYVQLTRSELLHVEKKAVEKQKLQHGDSRR